MMNILSEIAESAKERVEELKRIKSLDAVKSEAKNLCGGNNAFPFENALKGKDISFICEIKKASPSKGVIAEDFPYLQIAKEYEEAGAAAISVLTEPYYFKGSSYYLKEIVQNVKIPVLRKDFIIDEYQLYESKALGASAVLLIASLLDSHTLWHYMDICDMLGMSSLVETHSEEEIEAAIEAGARIIGVNNRDLKTFETDINNSIRLRSFVPDKIIFVSESGIKTKEDINMLRNIKANAVLIGETFMRSSDKKKVLTELKGM